MSAFRIIPPDAKGFSGLTSLDLGGGRAIAAMGVGPAVEAMLREAAARVKQRPTPAISSPADTHQIDVAP